MKKSLTVIYIYYNTPKEILDSIKSVIKTTKKTSFEIIVVDNNSPKLLPKINFRGVDIKIFHNSQNLGFGKAVNKATVNSSGKHILILNPDTIVTNNAIDLMVEKIEKIPKIGVLGPQLINAKGKILHSIASNPRLPDALFALSFINKLWPKNPYSRKYWALDIDRNQELETETVGGAAMLIPKKIFQKVGGFDEKFFLYFEEIDLCNRIKKMGYKILFFPKAKIIHLVGRSSNNKKFIKKHYERSRYIYFKKNYGVVNAILAESFLRLPSIFKN